MKKRIVSLLALLLCAVFVLGSCERWVTVPDFDSVFTGEDFQPQASYVAKTALSDFDDASLNDTADNLAVFVIREWDGVTHKVYNVETDKVVLTKTDHVAVTNEVSLVSLWDETAIIRVVATDTDEAEQARTTLYASDGTELASAEGDADITKNADLVLFDDVYYRAKDGSLTKLLEKSPLVNTIPEFQNWNEHYYYCKTTEGVKIYDADTLKFLTLFSPSSKYKSNGSSSWFVLENGDILFQGVCSLPDDASEYDYLKGKEKYAVDTLIFHVESGKTTALDLDYLVMVSLASNSHSYLQSVEDGYMPTISDFENLVVAYPIVDGYLEQSDHLAKTFLLANDGKIKGFLSDYLSVNSNDLPSQIASDRFLLSDVAGNNYLLNEKGEIVGEVGSADANAKYIVVDGKIYDNRDLSLLYDYEKEDYTLERLLADSVLLSKEVKSTRGTDVTQYSLYKGNAVHVLLDGERDPSYYYYGEGDYLSFRYTDVDTSVYAVYATDGTLLLSSKHEITVRCKGEKAAILVTTLEVQGSSPKTAYYRITK